MIEVVLIVVGLVVAFALGLAVGVIAQQAGKDALAELLAVESRRVNDLLDRIQAPTLGDYKAWQPEDLPDEPEERLMWDPTGLVSDSEPYDR